MAQTTNQIMCVAKVRNFNSCRVPFIMEVEGSYTLLDSSCNSSCVDDQLIICNINMRLVVRFGLRIPW